MARPKKKSVPTLNIITFCDIITVSMVAMFMVLIIVIDQAMKTPEVRPIPLALTTTNAPVYFECRSNQVFFIDRTELEILRAKTMSELRSRSVKQEDMLQNAMNQDIGNRFYRFDNSFLMMGLVALHPREGASGSSLADLDKPDDPIRSLITNLNVQATYAIFLVRDDAFDAYRKVRDLSAQRGLLSGWEYLARDEAITFEGSMSKIRAE
jgi:hypothetical protein